MKNKVMLKVLLLGICVVLSACSQGKGNESSSADLSQSQPQSSQSSQSADESKTETQKVSLGDFKTKNIKGEDITKDIFADYDLTMVNLWTTTCGYCIQEMPSLEAINNEMKEQGKSFNVVGICLDAGFAADYDNINFDKVNAIIDKTKITYETLIPDDVLMESKLKGVSAVPETFFVDKEGNIVGNDYLGAKSKEDWQKIIDSELNNLSK